MTVIRANLGWAFCYNLIAVPLAALGYLNPLFAGIAMSGSSLIVVANSLRLRRFTLAGGRGARGAPGGHGASPDRRRPPGDGSVAPRWHVELVRAVAGPIVCAVVLIGLLAGWAASVVRET